MDQNTFQPIMDGETFNNVLLSFDEGECNPLTNSVCTAVGWSTNHDFDQDENSSLWTELYKGELNNSTSNELIESSLKTLNNNIVHSEGSTGDHSSAFNQPMLPTFWQIPPKSAKRQRKQDINVRNHDRIEFLEVVSMGSSANTSAMHSTPLKSIENRLPQEKPNSSPIYEFVTVDMVEKRRESIARRLSNSAKIFIQFTEVEEYEILQRAHLFLERIKPDKKYCLLGNSEAKSVAEHKTVSGTDSPDFITGFPQPQRCSTPFPQAVYTVSENSYLFQDNRYKDSLPLGTMLIKPSSKLVELVAMAIDESPDGLLQVQQVYVYLMGKYPYFAFMDKPSTSSWRSSIRHALYQKWFKKIAISDEKIGSKGCFWTINRRSTPKEWRLPSSSPVQQYAMRDSSKNFTRPKNLVVSPAKSLDVLQQSLKEPTAIAMKNEGKNCSVPLLLSEPPARPATSKGVIWQPQVKYAVYGKPEPRRSSPYSGYGRMSHSLPLALYQPPLYPRVQYLSTRPPVSALRCPQPLLGLPIPSIKLPTKVTLTNNHIQLNKPMHSNNVMQSTNPIPVNPIQPIYSVCRSLSAVAIPSNGYICLNMATSSAPDSTIIASTTVPLSTLASDSTVYANKQ